ncbi:MAG: RagB/SusD family nutrient uptake outer membrane protein [Prevotella sp.]|nr:RagB/SusD family nutrient uptake outer membrane protein [Prevotella sp.]
MISFKNKYYHRVASACCVMATFLMGAVSLTSCDDFFKQESDDVLYADKEHLDNAVDTMYSVTGILNKLQALADRTVLLGEVRGDLVDLTIEASNDLRELASLSVSDNNIYNQPSDYYAVINNCNYFIAHADTALRTNSNEYVFLEEYCAVKAIRAWTYLQLVLNYGQVPFYTEPLLSKEAAEEAETASVADLQTICSYFINDLVALPARYAATHLNYRTIRGVDSRVLFFPLCLIRAELYLWRASATGSKEDYRQAALNYYQYINERNGTNSAYPTDITYVMWDRGSSTWTGVTSRMSGDTESYSENGELITMIAGDSIRAEGNYSELRNLFNSTEENDNKYSITPSLGMEEISESQAYCQLSYDGYSVSYAPSGLPDHQSGDLRLSNYWSEGFGRDRATGERIETQTIYKYRTRNVHIYRRMMVYIRLAEALNGAGYPRMAYQILSEGLSDRVMQEKVFPYYDTEDKSDSLFLAKFEFPDTRYAVLDVGDLGAGTMVATHNMMGIHTRGSGWTPMNEYYMLPNDTIEPDLGKRAQLIAEQQLFVDSLLLNENALEFAFEGTRYYDLMRFAMRSDNPGALMKKFIYARKGQEQAGQMQSEIKVDLSDQRNWYLSWKGKIGY